MIRTTYDDGEDSSDEEPAEDYEASHPDDVMNDDAMARSYDSHDLELDEFDHSMNKMSITPKNSLYYRFGDELKVQMPSRIRPSTSPESLWSLHAYWVDEEWNFAHTDRRVTW